MKSFIMKCGNCTIYTLRASCPKCGMPTVMALPPRYSPQDRYGEYRRRLKRGVH